MLIRSLILISLVGIGLSGCFPLRDNSILENVLIETLARPVVKTVVGGFVLGFNVLGLLWACSVFVLGLFRGCSGLVLIPF